MVELARKKKLFLMEAVWTRFLPAHGKAVAMMKKGRIGKVRPFQTFIYIHVKLPQHDVSRIFVMQPKNVTMTLGVSGRNHPGKRSAQKRLGGGTVLDYGSRCAHMAMVAFGGEKPEKVRSKRPAVPNFPHFIR